MIKKAPPCVKSRIGQAFGDFLAFGQVQQIHDRPPAAVALQLRQVIDLLPIDLALVREEQQIGVRAGDEQMLDRIFFLGLGAFQALAAAALGAIDADRRPLDVALVADRDDHRLFGDQVFQIDAADLFAGDFRSPVVAVLLFDLYQVVANDLPNVGVVRQDLANTRPSP